LLLPALFLEASAVSEDNAAITIPVDIGLDEAAVGRREGNVILRGGCGGEKDGDRERL
jgi:hypothetical protein